MRIYFRNLFKNNIFITKLTSEWKEKRIKDCRIVAAANQKRVFETIYNICIKESLGKMQLWLERPARRIWVIDCGRAGILELFIEPFTAARIRNDQSPERTMTLLSELLLRNHNNALSDLPPKFQWLPRKASNLLDIGFVAINYWISAELNRLSLQSKGFCNRFVIENESKFNKIGLQTKDFNNERFPKVIWTY